MHIFIEKTFFEFKIIRLKPTVSLFLLVSLVLLPSFAKCQGADTIAIPEGFRNTEANQFFTYFNTKSEIPADSAWKVFTQSIVPVLPLDKINLGSVNSYYWLALTLKNTSGISQDLYLEIRQPHIYRINFYQVLGDSVLLQSETGIQYDFYTRPSPNRYFSFPLSIKQNEAVTLLLMVHHLNSLSLPIHVLTQASAHENNYTQNLIWGYWLGFLSFCALFALVACILLRKSVFLWYYLYILSAALYGFTDQGYGFQFIFPGQANMDARVIIQLAVFNFVFLIKFSQGLLETKKHLPIIHRILNGIFYFLLFLLGAGIALPDVMFRLSTIVLPIVNLVTMVGLILLAFSGVKSFFTNRIIAIFYLTAYLTLVATGIFATLNYGFGVYKYFGPNPILIAYFLEAMILSVALVILFRQVQHEKSRLASQIANQEKQMYQQYITGIEKERSRIAGELHDDVGSRLSYLKKLLLSHSEESEKTAAQVEELIKDVRELSHSLAPPLGDVGLFQPLLEKLILDTRKSTGLNVKLQVHNYREILTPDQIQQLYRIVQEALNNIIKHAEATRVDIQLFGHEKEVNLSIEDDGKGFDAAAIHTGFGLNQLKIRVQSINGKIEINSQPGRGTLVFINVPIQN